MTKHRRQVKIMVASTVYHFQNDLTQICGVLTNYGYKVLNSHIGSIYTLGNKSNLQVCLDAVQECDIFLGIIRPYYGSGITHSEITEAIRLNKPRCFLVHHDVPMVRQVLRQYMYLNDGSKNPDFTFKKTQVLDDVRVIDMYNEAIQNGVPLDQRKSNWNQEYYDQGQVLSYIQTQFEDIKRVKKDIIK